MAGEDRQALGRCVAGLVLTVRPLHLARRLPASHPGFRAALASQGAGQPRLARGPVSSPQIPVCPALAGPKSASALPAPPPTCPVQHVDEEQLLYTFGPADGGAIECGFQEGEMLLLSVEGGCWASRAARRLFPYGPALRLLPSPDPHPWSFPQRPAPLHLCRWPFCPAGRPALLCLQIDPALHMPTLSRAGQHAAVARGFFYTCTATHLTVSLNKALRRGLLKPCGTPPDAAAGPAVIFDPSVRWRLDRDDVSSTFVRLRGNLFTLFRRVHRGRGQTARGARVPLGVANCTSSRRRLSRPPAHRATQHAGPAAPAALRRREFEMVRDPQTGRVGPGPNELERSAQAGRLRRLVVALEAPRYAPPPAGGPGTPAGMNSEQHAAVQRVLCAQDYTLVLGMPGAGKTTTIVSMVQARLGGGVGSLGRLHPIVCTARGGWCVVGIRSERWVARHRECGVKQRWCALPPQSAVLRTLIRPYYLQPTPQALVGQGKTVLLTSYTNR